jgi:uncharacterized membrane protein
MADKKLRAPDPTSGEHYLYTQRINSLDLTRILAMVFMIQGHVIYALASPEAVNVQVFPWDVWNYLRGLTAPIFLTVSGAVQVFANKRDEYGKLPKKTVFRRFRMGLILMLIGYTMMFPAERVWDIFFLPASAWSIFFQVNILQLIGISLILLLGIFLFTRNDRELGILSLIFALTITFLTPTVLDFDWFIILPEFMAAYLSSWKGSIFPIFPFTAFVFYGAAIGSFLKQIGPEKRTKTIIYWGIPAGAVFFSIGYLYNYFTGSGSFSGLTLSNVGVHFIRFGMVLGVFSISALIYLLTSGLSKYYSIFSKRALFIYVIHLFLLYGTVFFNGLARIAPNSLGLADTLIAVFAIEAISLGTAYFYEYAVRKYPNAKRFFMILLGAYLIYMLII